MPSTVVAVLATAFGLQSSVQAAAIHHFSSCNATSNWPGWAGIKHAFIFGDSYTTTGFNASLTQPTRTNPLGNPTYPGYTAANGPNWVDFLTVKYNASTLLTYNLAYGGATINSALVAPYLPTVSSVAQQIENEWFPAYASKPSTAPWNAQDTLFAIFDGINDVGNSWSKGLPATTTLNGAIFAVYRGLVDELYYAGARNFAFLNVPPVDRAPLALANSAADQATEKADIAAWNSALMEMAKSLKAKKPDVNVFTVDTNKYFTQVLDKPSSYPQTAGYKNTTAYCTAYENGTPQPDSFNLSCGIPVNQYFWLNSLHPTYPMQDVLAEAVAEQLGLGPNVC
ncbi:uncharacterized protein LY89DRAFT_579510 [Mollisia scopiformis]|uniref:Carbohydrate esterase family 16 protein n=1 Tax=Mollisia scopiformis TaxID=149040 RepID=A0A194XKJ3_MOLSC|nr:uncharacterized protein LY89DRAFT_579510 [Mollisia scopiformis]KUJ20678.1 hypothetical protein LY89DRAFT_579510 [Mollisia scopiformis]